MPPGELEQYLQVNCFEDPLLEFPTLIHFQLRADVLLSTHAKSDANSVDVSPCLVWLVWFGHLLLVSVSYCHGFTVSYDFMLQ